MNEGADGTDGNGIGGIAMYGNDSGCMKFGRVIGGNSLFCLFSE